MAETSPIVLASASPRRRDLLSELGVEFDVVVPDVDEDRAAAGLAPASAVAAVVEAKLTATNAALTSASVPVVIACDTMVVGVDGMPVGKPIDRADARRLLDGFSDSAITVISGLGVSGGTDGSATIETVETVVRLRPISAAEIAAYVATGAADDKAGGLELQDRAAPFIVDVEGCWTNVVGLPMCRVRALVAARLDDAVVGHLGGADVEADAGAACGCLGRPDSSAVGLDDLLDDRKTEPGSRR